MKKIRSIGKKQPRIVNTSKKMEKIPPSFVAAMLGAEPVPQSFIKKASADVEVVKAERPIPKNVCVTFKPRNDKVSMKNLVKQVLWPFGDLVENDWKIHIDFVNSSPEEEKQKIRQEYEESMEKGYKVAYQMLLLEHEKLEEVTSKYEAFKEEYAELLVEHIELKKAYKKVQNIAFDKTTVGDHPEMKRKTDKPYKPALDIAVSKSPEKNLG